MVDKYINILLSSLEKYYLFFLSFIAILIFYPAILSSELIDIDKQIVIDPLRNINSLSDYWRGLFKILDLQPIRDFVFVILIKVTKMLNHQIYGLVNIIIWTATIFITEKILNTFIPRYSKLCSLVILIHPLIVWTITWPSALKHFLASFFIICSSLYAVKIKQGNTKNYNQLFLLIFYLLALNSQPIIILFPLPFIFYIGIRISFKRYKSLTALLLLTMSLFLFLNYFYYNNVYPLQIFTVKLESFNLNSLAFNIMGLSRSLTQIILPLNYSMFYNTGSILNLFGIPITLIIMSTQLNIKDRTRILFFIILIFYPLAIIYLKETNIFVSDSYLLIPLISYAIMISSFFLEKFSIRKYYVLIFILIITMLKSNYEIKIAIDSGERFKYSYLREKSCRNSLAYAGHLLRVLNIPKFKEVGQAALSNHCALSGKYATEMVFQVYSAVIYFEDEFSVDKKINLLNSVKSKSVITFAFLANLYKKNNQVEESKKMKDQISRYKLDSKYKKLIIKIEKEL